MSSFNSFATTRAGRVIHDQTVDHMLHAPMSWFESTPSGNIEPFFRRLVYGRSPFFIYLDDICHFCCIILLFLIVINMIVPHIIPVLIFAMVCSFQVVAVDRTNREVKGQQILPKPDYDIGSRDCEQPVLNPCNGLRSFCGECTP